MSPNELMAVVGFFVTMMGAIFGGWRYVEMKLRFVFDRADKTDQKLADHKLHVAETYVTKAGMQEQTTQIMRAIENVGSRLDGVHERLDRVLESQAKARTTRS